MRIRDNVNDPSRSEMKISRRRALKKGLAGAAGLLLTERLANATAVASQPRAKSVIQIWMWGGPAQMDTFDPKPDSGSEYTGPLSKPITTNIDGIIIGELLPLLTAEKESVELTLKAPASPSRAPITLHLSGRAQIDGQEVVRRVVPADDMMQAFIYRHLVPAEDLEVAVMGRAGNNRPTARRANTDRPRRDTGP